MKFKKKKITFGTMCIIIFSGIFTCEILYIIMHCRDSSSFDSIFYYRKYFGRIEEIFSIIFQLYAIETIFIIGIFILILFAIIRRLREKT